MGEDAIKEKIRGEHAGKKRCKEEMRQDAGTEDMREDAGIERIIRDVSQDMMRGVCKGEMRDGG